MHQAGHHLFADAALAGDQHRRIKRSNTRGQIQHRAECLAPHLDQGRPLQRNQPLGAASQFARHPTQLLGQVLNLALDVGGVKVGQVRIDLGSPRGAVLAHRRAHPLAHGATALLHEVHVATERKRHEAAGVAGQGPTCGVRRVPEHGRVLLGLGRAVPGHFHLEVAGTLIHLQFLRHPARHPLQGVQARPGLDQVDHVVPLEHAAHGRRIGLPPEIGEAGQNAAGLSRPDHFKEILAKLGEGVGAVQDQATALEIDSAIAEFQQFVQLQIFDSHDAAISI